MKDQFYIYRPMLDLIGLSEGTDKARGYNETLSYGAYTGGDRNLIAMTLAEIEQLQTAMLKHPKNKLNSSALGRYQIVRATLRKLVATHDLPMTSVFTALLQDRLGVSLLRGRGIDVWLTGEMSDGALLDALAKEWASLPTSAGVGYYGGQHAAVTVTQVKRALNEVRLRHREAKTITPSTPVAETPAPNETGFAAFLNGFLKALFGRSA